MKALFYKDFCSLKKQLQFYLVFYGIYTVIMLQTHQFQMLAGVMIVVCSTLPVSAIAYDEQANWQRFGQVLPATRKNYVSEKYCLGIGGILLSALLVFATALAGGLLGMLPFGKEELLNYGVVTATVLVVGLMMLALGLPVTFQLGVEKSRFFILICNLLIFFVIAGLASLEQVQNAVSKLIAAPALLAGAMIGLPVVSLAGSFGVSAAIYKKKELS